MIRKILFLILCLGMNTLFSQDYFPKNDGVKNTNTNYTAFTNAKIYVSPTKFIESGTLLIKDGIVVSSGASVNIPANTVTIDLKGKSIYPSFIELYSGFGIEKPKRTQGSSRPQYDSSREGFYWNDHIMPEQNALDFYKYDKKSASELHKAGFGVVNTHMQDGIVRGTGSLIALANDANDSERILSAKSAQYSSMRKSVRSRQSYPTSPMGVFALLRQLKYDADWYATGNSKTSDQSLEAYLRNQSHIQIIEANSRANAIRVDKVGDDIGVNYLILGGGDEYERIKDVKNTNASFIIPMKFPKPYDVEDSFLTNMLELEDLREWNQRPTNPKILSENNINFAITTHSLKSPTQLKTNLLKTIKYGFDKEKAYQSLTSVPAKLIKQENKIGSLNNGAFANFLITSGHPLEEKTVYYENWVKGYRHILKPMNIKDVRGNYSFSLLNKSYELKIEGDITKPKATLKQGDVKFGTKTTYKNDWINFVIKDNDTVNQTFTRITARINKQDNLQGKAILSNGNEAKITLVKQSDFEEKKPKDKKDSKKEPKVMSITYPNGAYGFNELPKQETLLFKNATVWTNEKDGILVNTDVLIKNGKIAKIGKNLSSNNATIIDATGKHLTAGIIDEHSHLATASVNESGQNSSAEVTIEDVVNPEHIGIYRNLAGGVTSIQILHGSANPIGGRSAIIKLKWGESADKLIYDNTPKFIKFALGENVKQSNWGDSQTVRFPQTRMGVEQLFIDYFSRAKEYDTKKKSGEAYRKDIEMEVLAEILNKERFISCHSYVQSEINMLMKVAEKFDFNINTFTHILEGYKVADKMKNHGVGGSTFSDWWAYKFEVNDAIPYNASIMHKAGVLVAINSDDAEMSRRLNQEAAKSVKYGNISEEEAWKFVTLNPAKLLHIDDRVGSIKVGKDADVVLWSDNPLSVYAKAEKTIIEGVTYFDIERDLQMREDIKKEKNELINMMLQEKNKGLKTQPIKKKEQQHLNCDSLDDH